MEAKSTVEIDGEVVALQEKESALQADLKSTQERGATLAHEKDALRSLALRNGDAKAKTKLNELRQALAAAQLEASDITDEIAAVNDDITELQTERAEATKAESWQSFLKVAAEVEKESAAIDCTVFEFFDHLKPHAERLAKLNNLLARADVHAKGFSLETFRRHLDEKFRTGFGEYFGRVGRVFHKGNAYEQPYSIIIEQRVKNIIARHDGAVVDEPTEQEAEAVNE